MFGSNDSGVISPFKKFDSYTERNREDQAINKKLE
jgi:hypothetical protein